MSEQTLTLRMNLLGSMNEFIKTSIPSKFYINLWPNDCIPAEAAEEELETIASDNEAFKDCVNTFNFICSKCL